MSSEITSPELTPVLNDAMRQMREQLLQRHTEVEAWFRHQWTKTQPLVYGSVDLRNAGFKLAPVDTNLFSAGFNNLNPEFKSLHVQAAQATVEEIFSDQVSRLLLIPENHTRNPFYFENLHRLYDILVTAGFEVRIGTYNEDITEPQSFPTPSGATVLLEPLIREGDKVGVKDFFPCCILLNNDLSSGIPDVLQNISQKIMPPLQLGWATRLKSEHFAYYEKVCAEFAELLDVDPWLINPYFDQCPEVDFMRAEGQECLHRRAEGLFKRIQKKYDEYGIIQKPFLVVKADQGTYGMAVMMIREPEDLLKLNRKQRTRMSTQKGGHAVTKAIIQEGVYSFEKVDADDSIAEPVIYLFGRHVIGGFYRVHEKKGPDENLNAPGMNFQPLPFARPCNLPSQPTEQDKCNRFYIYGVIARLAFLAASRELAAFQGEK